MPNLISQFNSIQGGKEERRRGVGEEGGEEGRRGGREDERWRR